MALAKNIMASPAASDLGLGDQLKAQLDAATIEKKKKLLQQAQQMAPQQGSAAQVLFMGNGGYGNY